MFGCVVAGRLVQTNMQQIDETHATFELPSVSTINHICVFLLGTVPFPDGYGATVHLHWPGKGFQLLGALSNDKPSAIFRVRGTFSSTTTLNRSAFQDPNNGMSDGVASTGETAILGIAVEPLSVIQAQLASIPSAAVAPRSSASALSDPTVLAEKIVKHLFNFISSFAVPPGGVMTPETYIQMSAITRWYESFVAKIQAGGVGFLERQE
ncbi:DUF775-domain-containing protein [Fomitiporia mediterranea MF3/22]|uniref:DUF775-domain-containing protein n=1 Tax=Fomitiporia mediterranea (strain MF3/22) TaxID=694068 RepID=UPI0004409C54|nr:DUF775-domain-containing protein [Fomitiporia mediterranea MF3/22]EJD01996.1 DUF775-domain-containing protein [Fomitiporia mediterranea MF3/22]